MAEPNEPWPVPWQPVHGPEKGLLRRFEAFLLRATLACATRLGDGLLERFYALLARVAVHVDRRHTAAARTFLVQALGELPERELSERVRASYRHLFRVVVDSERLLRVPAERLLEHFEVRWTDDARRWAAWEGGRVSVSAHIGQWEASSVLLPLLGVGPVYAVAKPAKNFYVSRDMQASRERRGMRVLPRRGAMQDAPRVLEAGGTIGLLLDQRARKKPVLAPFFGRPARCDRSSAVLLRRWKVPVAIFACYLREKPLTYVLEFHDVIWPAEIEGEAPEAIVGRVNRAMEASILRHPEQYFWLHDRYKDTPLPNDASASADEDPEPSEPQVRGGAGNGSGQSVSSGHAEQP